MLEFIKNNLSNITGLLSLFFSVVALVISSLIMAKGWWRQRNIYKIEFHTIYTNPTMAMENRLTSMGVDEINQKLSSGEYMIMNTEKNNEFGYHILLGKIKK